MKVEIWEMECVQFHYSDNNKNCWDARVYPALGHSSEYSGYNSAGEALDHLLSVYPDVELEVTVTTNAAFYKLNGEKV